MKRISLFIILMLLTTLIAACGEETAESTVTSDSTAIAESPDSNGDKPATSGITAIKDRGKLVAGVKYDVPLFGFLNPDTNQLEGFDIDLSREVAKRIFGDENAVEFKEAVSKNRIPYLEDGTVDVVFSTMTANAERAEQIDFSDTYYVAGQSLLVPVASDITDVAGLDGRSVGTVKGSTSEKNIREFAPGATVELFDTYSEAVQAMSSGRVDAVTTDDIILYGFEKNSPDRFKVVGGQFTQEPYAAGIRKGNTDVLNEVNETLRAIKADGTWAKLYQKWISDETPETPPESWETVYENAPGNTSGSTSDDAGMTAIKERGKLVAGVKYDVPLFGFLNPDTNQLEGFDIDLSREVAKRIFGDENAVEFKEAVSKNRIPYLEDGTVDVVFSTMTANAERAEQIDFSDTYYVAGQSLLVPVASDITDVAGLDGRSIGTVKGSTSEKNIREFAPGATVELFDTYSEAVQAMSSGRVDAVTTDDIILYGFEKNSPERFKVVGGQFTQEPYAAGIRKGNTGLLNEVNQTLRDIKTDGTWAKLYQKWISDETPETPPESWETVYENAPNK